MRKTLLLLSAVMLMACQESLEERCLREAKTFTKKNCPARLSDVITIDSMTFDKDTHTLHYSYTMTFNEADTTFLQPDVWRKTLLRNLKDTPSMKPYLDAGYNMQYTYHSAADPTKMVYDVTFTKKDYQ